MAYGRTVYSPPITVARSIQFVVQTSIVCLLLVLLFVRTSEAQGKPEAREFLRLAVLQAIDRQFSRFIPPDGANPLRNSFWKPEWPAEDKAKFFDAVSTTLAREVRDKNINVTELGKTLLDLDPFNLADVCAEPARACYTWHDIRNSTEEEIKARIERGETLLVDARDQLLGRFIASTGPFLVAVEQSVVADIKSLPIENAVTVVNKALAASAQLEAKVAAVRALTAELQNTDAKSARNAALRYLLGFAGVSVAEVESMKAAAEVIENIFQEEVAELEGGTRQAGKRLQRQLALKLKAQTEILEVPYKKIVALRKLTNCGVDLSKYLPDFEKPCEILIKELAEPATFADRTKNLLEEESKKNLRAVETTAREIEQRYVNEGAAALAEISPFELVRTVADDGSVTFDIHLVDFRKDASGGIRTPSDGKNQATGKGHGFIDTGVTVTYRRKVSEGKEVLTFVKDKPRSVYVRERAMRKFLQGYGLPAKLPFELDLKNLDVEKLTQRVESLRLKVKIPVPFVTGVAPLTAEISLPPEEGDYRQTRANLEEQIGQMLSTLQERANEKIAGQRVEFTGNAWLDGFRDGPGNDWAGGRVDYRSDLNVRVPGTVCANKAVKFEISLDTRNWTRPTFSPAAVNQAIVDCFSEFVGSHIDQAIARISQLATENIPEGVYRLLVEATRLEIIQKRPVITYTSCISGGVSEDAVFPACKTNADGSLNGQKIIARLDLYRGSASVLFNPRLENALKREALNRLKNYARVNLPNEVEIFGINAKVEGITGQANSYHLTVENVPGVQASRVRVTPVGISVSENGRPAIDFQGASIRCAKQGQPWENCIDIKMIGVGEFGPIRLKPVGFSGQSLMLDVEIRDPFSNGGDFQSAGRFTVDPVDKRIDATDLKPLIVAQVRERLKELIQSSGILGAHRLSDGVVIEVNLAASESADLKTLLTSYDITINSIQLGPVALPTTVEIRNGKFEKVKVDESLLTGVFTNALSKQLALVDIPCKLQSLDTDRLADLAAVFGCRFNFGGVVQIGLDNIVLDARGLQMPQMVEVPIPGEIPLGTTGLVLVNLKVRVNFQKPEIIGMVGQVVPISSAVAEFVAFDSRLDLDISEQTLDARGDLMLLRSLALAAYTGGIDLRQRAFFWEGGPSGLFEDIFAQQTKGSTNGESGVTNYKNHMKVFDVVSQTVDITLTAKAELDVAAQLEFLGFRFDGSIKTREKLQHMTLEATGDLKVAGHELSNAHLTADPYGAAFDFKVLGLGIEITALSLGSITQRQVEDAILSLFRFDKVLEALLKSILRGKIKIALFQPVGVGDGNNSPMRSDGNEGHADGTGGREGGEGEKPPGGSDNVKVEDGSNKGSHEMRGKRDPRALTTHYASGNYFLCPKNDTLAGEAVLRVWTVPKDQGCKGDAPPWASYVHPDYKSDLSTLKYSRHRYFGSVLLHHDGWKHLAGHDNRPCQGVYVWTQMFIDTETDGGRLIVHTEGIKHGQREVPPRRSVIKISQLLNGEGDWNGYLSATFRALIDSDEWNLKGILPGDLKQMRDDFSRHLASPRSDCDFVTKGTLTLQPFGDLKLEDLQFYWQVRNLTNDARLVSRSNLWIWVPRGTLLRDLLDAQLFKIDLTRDLVGLSYGAGWEVMHKDADFKLVLLRVGGEERIRVYRDGLLTGKIEVDGLPIFSNGRKWQPSDPRILFLTQAAGAGFNYVDWREIANGALGAVHVSEKRLRINPVGHALIQKSINFDQQIDVIVGSDSWKNGLKRAQAICTSYGSGILAEEINGLEGLKKALFFFEVPPTDRYCVNGRVLFKSMSE